MPLSELVSTDPCTGEVVWRGPAAEPTDVAHALSRARRAFPAWADAPFETRADIARRYRDLMRANEDGFARLISRETGKPLWEARAEAASVAAKVDISIRAYAERTGVRVSEENGQVAALRHKPHGVLAVLGPYNYPAHLPNGHIVPALLAGNAVVFKPSPLTPAVAEMMAALWRDAGLAPGVLEIVQGGAETGRALAAGDVDGVLFTGGVEAGLALHRAFAGAPQKMLALEMGGDSPIIVWEPADIEQAAAIVVQSAFISAGQRCNCARRLIVPEGDSAIVEAVAARMDAILIGAPFDEPAPFCGPVIDNAAADRLEAAVADLEGAVLRPLRRLRPDRPFLAPALIEAQGASRRLAREIFGPVLRILRVKTFEAAIEEANATPFGLAAGVVTQDEALYRQAWRGLRAGLVNWNAPMTGASSAAPFGGIGLSGNHRPSAFYAADYCAFPVAGVERAAPPEPQSLGFRP